MRENAGKMRTRITPYTDTYYAVSGLYSSSGVWIKNYYENHALVFRTFDYFHTWTIFLVRVVSR